MGRKSKLDLLNQKGVAKKARSKNVTLEAIVEAPDLVIPIGSTPSTPAQISVNPKTFEKFNSEVATVFTPNRVAGSRRDIQDKREVVFGVERRFVKVAVNKHANIIKQKFPELDIKELTESVYLILRDTFNNRIKATKDVEWFDNNRTEIIASNFRQLQNFMTEVKKDIRFKARKSIDESKSKVKQDNLVGTAIVIGGIDVRDKASGGDLLPTDLEDGRIVEYSKLPAARRRELTSINKSRGVQIGHAFGPGIGNVAAFTDNAEIFDLFDPLEQAELIGLRKRAKKIDARTTIEANLLKKTGRKLGEVTVVYLESTEGNSTEGAKLGRRIIAPLKKLIIAKSRQLLNYRASLSIAQRLEQVLVASLTGVKPKDGVINKKFKYSKKVVESLPLYGPKLQTSKSRKSNTRSNVGSQTQDLSSLINFLNQKLHDKIRDNMGKGGSQQILNYRTGRFARSAKIQTLYPIGEKNAIGAQVKYMRHPYAVFEPKGRLHKPGRDPHRIFGKSIRQLLQEEKIANLRRVKVVLRG